MPRKALSLVRGAEEGLTLVELLVVLLLLGVLATIAVPAFGNELQVSDDAAAQANVRELADHVEDCWSRWHAYPACDDAVGLELDDFELGSEPGQAAVSSAGYESFAVTAVSHATGGGANHVFTISRDASGTALRTCGPEQVRGRGGCPSSGRW